MLSIQNLSKTYANGIHALRNVCLEMESGIFGLLGPNGAGKTTLIRLLALAEQPTMGELTIDGKTLIRGHANPEVKQRQGFLPDEFPLYNE